MDWLLPALGAALLWGLVQTLDKLSIGRLIPYVPAYLAVIAAVGLAAAIIQRVMGVPVAIGKEVFLLSVLSGLLTILYTYLFLSSLQTLDAPEASTILLLVPIFATVWGILFFDETISITGGIGIAVILTGAYLATREEEQMHPRDRKGMLFAVFLLVAASIVISLQRGLEKYLLDTLRVNIDSVFFWERIGVFAVVALMLVVPGIRSKTSAIFRDVRGVVFTVPLTAELAALAAIYAGLAALRTGPLGLTNTLISASPVFALLLVTGLNALRQDTIPDSGTRKQFIPRLAAILFTLAGIWLLGL